MKSFVLGLITGAIVTGLTAILVGSFYLTEKKDFFVDQGYAEAQKDITTKLRETFPPLETLADYSTLYDFKETSVVVVEEQGVKTLRIDE